CSSAEGGTSFDHICARKVRGGAAVESKSIGWRKVHACQSGRPLLDSEFEGSRDLSTYNQVIENTGMSAGEHDSGDGPRGCIERGVGRVPTRSAQLVNGKEGPS